MRYKKTYGIHGLLEWHGDIVCHGAKMRVDFTNGSTTAYGVSPATFTTSDALTQHFIENSEQFKGGRIHIVRSVELPDAERPVGAASMSKSATQAGKPTAASEGGQDGATLRIVEATSLDDAKEWLVEHCGEKASNLRSKSAILASAEKHGVEFKGI